MSSRQIKTARGYTGEIIGQSVDGKSWHVVLRGCTYDMDHSFDVVPKEDVTIVEPGERLNFVMSWSGLGGTPEKYRHLGMMVADVYTPQEAQFITWALKSLFEVIQPFPSLRKKETRSEEQLETDLLTSVRTARYELGKRVDP